MKNLLLVSNISEDDNALIEYAAKFCKHYSWRLIVLHIRQFQDPVLISSVPNFQKYDLEIEEMMERKIIRKIQEVTKPILPDTMTQISVQKGNKETILSQFLNSENIDLVIIGNKDLERESEFINHKEILLNVTDTPILVVPDLQLFKPLKKFNFLTTHTENDMKDLLALKQLFPNAKLRLTHFDDSGETNKNATRWLTYVKSKLGKNVEYQIIDETVPEYIKKENMAIIDMYDSIVFTARKRNFWQRIFDPSTTLSLLSDIQLPSLIFKINA